MPVTKYIDAHFRADSNWFTASGYVPRLVLSLFPGIDLLGRGFELEGYYVVRGPDLLFGRDIESFQAPTNVFEGVIAGSPCQDFSRSRRTAPTGKGVAAIVEFTRVVTQTSPIWWMLENVPGVPSVHIAGFITQRINLNARECGLGQNRLRCFQVGTRDGAAIIPIRKVTTVGAKTRCCMATEGTKKERRSFSEFCSLQGLPANFDLKGWSLKGKYRAVGNGVPIPMARVIAAAISDRYDTLHMRVCICECGRYVGGRATHATPACRKRMERRRRDIAGVSGPG